jgi:hypothetical protein
MFASKITKDITVRDGDKDVKVTIRKLSGRSLQNASEARQVSVARMAKAMGAEMVQAYQARQEATDKASKILDPSEARFTLYDRETVLVAGIASWDVDIDVAEGVKDLDEDTANDIFRAIITLSVPTEEERKAVQGKA